MGGSVGKGLATDGGAAAFDSITPDGRRELRMKIQGVTTATSAIKASGIQNVVFFFVFFSIVPLTPVKIHNDVST